MYAVCAHFVLSGCCWVGSILPSCPTLDIGVCFGGDCRDDGFACWSASDPGLPVVGPGACGGGSVKSTPFFFSVVIPGLFSGIAVVW
ncbi:hypothetical protein C8R46DRAFT_1109233 [Mycena filopes]|nr:hypothetical protein C8R46DRAFT_1109233 [Mycena filopes]